MKNKIGLEIFLEFAFLLVLIGGSHGANLNPWSHLVTVDCAGNAHFLANSPFTIILNSQKIHPEISSKYFELAYSVATCKIPSLSRDDFAKAFLPLPEFWLWLSEHNPQQEEPFSNFWDTGFKQLINAFEVNSEINFPCTYTDYLLGGCQFSLDDLQNTASQFNFDIKRCPGSFFPSVEVTLSGMAASHLFRPCNDDLDCSEGALDCFKHNITHNEIMSALDSLVTVNPCAYPERIFGPDQITCNDGNPFGAINDWWFSIFDDGTPSSSSYAGFCLPQATLDLIQGKENEETRNWTRVDSWDPSYNQMGSRGVSFLLFPFIGFVEKITISSSERVSSSPGVPINFWMDSPETQGTTFGNAEISISYDDDLLPKEYLQVTSINPDDSVAFNVSIPLNDHSAVEFEILCPYPSAISSPEESSFVTFQQLIGGEWVDALTYSCLYSPPDHFCEAKIEFLVNGMIAESWGLDCCPGEECTEWGHTRSFRPGFTQNGLSAYRNYWDVTVNWLDSRISHIDRLLFKPGVAGKDCLFDSFMENSEYGLYYNSSTVFNSTETPSETIGSPVLSTGSVERGPAIWINNKKGDVDSGWEIQLTNEVVGFSTVNLEMRCSGNTSADTEPSYVQFLNPNGNEVFNLSCASIPQPFYNCFKFAWFVNGVDSGLPYEDSYFSYSCDYTDERGFYWSRFVTLDVDPKEGKLYFIDSEWSRKYKAFDIPKQTISSIKVGTRPNTDMLLKGFSICRGSPCVHDFWTDDKISRGPERRNVDIPFTTFSSPTFASLPTPPSLMENPFSNAGGPLAGLRRLFSFDANTGILRASFNNMLDGAIQFTGIQSVAVELSKLFRSLSDCLTTRTGKPALTDEQLNMRMLPWLPEFWINQQSVDLGSPFADLRCTMTQSVSTGLQFPNHSCPHEKLHSGVCEFGITMKPFIGPVNFNIKFGKSDALPMGSIPGFVVDVSSALVTWVNQMSECQTIGSNSDCDNVFGANQAQFECKQLANAPDGLFPDKYQSFNTTLETDPIADFVWDSPIQEIPGSCRSFSRFLQDINQIRSDYLDTDHTPPTNNPNLLFCTPVGIDGALISDAIQGVFDPFAEQIFLSVDGTWPPQDASVLHGMSRSLTFQNKGFPLEILSVSLIPPTGSGFEILDGSLATGDTIETSAEGIVLLTSNAALHPSTAILTVEYQDDFLINTVQVSLVSAEPPTPTQTAGCTLGELGCECLQDSCFVPFICLDDVCNEEQQRGIEASPAVNNYGSFLFIFNFVILGF